MTPLADRVSAPLLALSVSVLLAGCAPAPGSGTPSTSEASSAPYTPTPPRAVDLRTASQALALQISAEGVPVDGLDCRPGREARGSVPLRCTVTTGGEGHPDQIAEATWDRSAATVHLTSVEPVPFTPRPPLATAAVAGADDADVSAARILRAVRPALVASGAITDAADLTCSVLHAGAAGCEVRVGGKVARYFNVVRNGSALSIYPASG